MANFIQSNVTVLVPEGSCSEHDKTEARSDGLTIVEAKKQKAFPNPTDWLINPPEDLSTDVVVGIGEKLGQVAQLWRERGHCKSLCVVTEPLPVTKKLDRIRSELHNLKQSEVNRTLCQGADIPIATGPKMTKELSAPLQSHNKRVFDLTPGIIRVKFVT